MRKVREQRDDLVSRVPRLQVLFMLVLVVIGTAYWRVQVVRGDYYRDLSDNNRLRRVPLRAPRGLIYDRDGRLLVDNVASYNLLLDRSLTDDVDRAVEFAASTLGRERSELEAALEREATTSRYTPVLLAENLTLAEVARIGVAELEYPEFDIEIEHLRVYRQGAITAHLLGYLGEATEADLTRPGAGYQPGDLVGRKGVERVFDLSLRGRDGERELVVDTFGRVRQEHGRRAAAAGRRLDLTLDLELQQEAARYLEGRVGSAVALDPRNGEVLMLASAPSYNPNLFTRRLNREQWRALVEAEHHPLQNRAIQNAHAPGSIFKPIIAAAGLAERVVDGDDAVFCAGQTMIYNRRTRCWLRGGHGWVNLRSAIERSCDIYFYQLGQKLGINRIADYARRFGLGAPTGFDIPGEKAGLIPDTQWSLQRRGSPWYPGETVSVAIGQGPILVTPLQAARAFAAIANGGRLVRPHVAAGTAASTREIDVSPRVLATIREALWAAVNARRGTGGAARVDGIEVAGKTGTAQVVEQRTWTRSEDLPFEHRDHAWFASFAPEGDAELVVVAFVEHGGHGSDAAAPLARKIYESHFGDPDAR